jgi:hypothetical protein
VDGISILQITSANASGSITYGGTQLGGLSDRGWSGWADRAFNMSTESLLTLAHTGSTLTIDFYASGDGWQGYYDESWAIENLKVEAVPVPPTLLLLAPGLLGLMGIRRRLVNK